MDQPDTRPTDGDFTAVTTQARQRRHWALTKELRRCVSGGSRGSTLCDGYGGGAMDQALADAQLPSGWRKRTVIIDLPPCKQCDKSRTRRIEGRPT